MLIAMLHVAAAVPGLTNPMLGGRAFRHVEWFLSRHARNKPFAILFVFLFALALRTALLPIVAPGIPAIHDEYSYLLQADMLASGHLAMPTHPMWEHFQTFHVLQKPSYASKHFPGQATFLALGQKLLGHPWWGVLLSVAGMCAAMVWCLQGFLPPGWALFGGVVTALQFATTHYWDTSYWGGAVPAMGGCLALGAVGRLLATPDWKAGLLFGLGASLLAATRPYEGAILCAILLVWLTVATLRRQGPRPAMLLRRAALPALAVLAVGLGGLLAYNQAVTGSAWTLPYALYIRQYDRGFWLIDSASDAATASIPREMLRYNAEWSAPAEARESTWRGKLAGLPHRVAVFATLLFPIFLLPVFVAPIAFFASRPTRAPMLAAAAALLASLSIVWSSPHYFAPALGLFCVLWLRILRWMRAIKPFGRPIGLSLVRLLPFILIYTTVLGVLTYPRRSQSDNEIKAALRAQIEQKLEALPGKHLVLVTYGPHSNVHAEWVYNRADIDQSKIVWARDLGPEKNAALFAYFKDRQRWCASIDARRLDFGPCTSDPSKPAAP